MNLNEINALMKFLGRLVQFGFQVVCICCLNLEMMLHVT